MKAEEIKLKTQKFALNTIYLCEQLPNELTFYVIKKQLIRCCTSVGANYRAACRAKSKADFINKLKIVEEETDESIYFLELLEQLNIKDQNKKIISKLKQEADSILAIMVSSIKTTRKNLVKNKV